MIEIIEESIFTLQTSIYASTPISPPLGYGWVSALFILALLVLDLYIYRNRLNISAFLIKESWNTALAVITFVIIISFPVIVFIPVLLLRSEASYNLTFDDVGGYFIVWNLVGLSILLAFKLRTIKALKITGIDLFQLLAGTTLIYLLAMIPYVSSNAYVWGDNVHCVKKLCQLELEEFGKTLYVYSTGHDTRLPTGNDAREMLRVLQPDNKHVNPLPAGNNTTRTLRAFRPGGEEEALSSGSKLSTCTRVVHPYCPLDWRYKKNPEPYEWNAAVAGKNLDELKQMDGNTPILTCRNKHHKSTARNVLTVSRYIKIAEDFEAKGECPWGDDFPHSFMGKWEHWEVK